MPKVLLIDDDPHLRALLTKVLGRNDFEVSTASDGLDGLERAKRLRPDLVILDIIMPGMDGFEVAQKLREDPRCVHIPIMVLTAYASPYGRKSAVDAGVDAFVTKPFAIEDIVARAKMMARDVDRSPNYQTAPLASMEQARLLTIHSLRGGLGCTSLAINLALTLKHMWDMPTLLMDADFASGQVAESLNWRGGLSWSDLYRATITNTTSQALEDESIKHDSGLHVLAAPREAGDVDQFSPRVVSHGLQLMQKRYEYVIADLAHDCRDNTAELLKESDKILHLLSPEAVSLRMTRKALNTYAAMGIQAGNVELVLVDTRPNDPSNLEHIEKIVGRPLTAYIPYAKEMTRAASKDLAFVDLYPGHIISGLLEDMAYMLSKASHRETTSPMGSVAKSKRRMELAADKNGYQNGSQNGTGRGLLRRMGLMN